MRGERSALLAAGGIALAAAAALFARFRSHPLLGWDTFPEIASSRIQGFGDFLGTFSEQTAEGFYPAAFYRPVFNLSLAADYAVYGIEPAGYYATGALLVAATGFALFVLTKRLLGPGRGIGAFAALVTFLLLPVQVEVMIPSRRMEVLCALFTVLALASQVSRLERGVRGSALPVLFTLLAVGAKEPGVVLPPLVFLLVLLRRQDLPPSRRWGPALRLAGAHLAAVALVFALRFAAIGGLGGHPSTDPAGALLDLPTKLGAILARLSTFALIEPRWLVLTSAGAVVLLATGACLALALRAEPRPGAGLVTTAFAAAWLVLLAAVQGAAGLLQPWHLLLPGLALALLLGASLEAATRRVAAQRSLLHAAGAVVVVLWVVFQARYSPIVHDVGHWARAGSAVRLYLDELGHRVETADPGAEVRVRPPPSGVKADPNPLGTTHATPITVYSLPAWIELRFPERRVDVRHPRLEREPDEDADVVVVVGSPPARR